ncbi:MAG TPA: hypothetical protein VNN18_05655 [Candidatus Xenobia bacterium]|nr:hypothetical protein [Candidatus Xenobia bacterium]
MFAAIVFALTVGMILVHAGEWVLLGRLASATRGGPARASWLGRAVELMNFLRFEVFYYVVLFVFWLLNRDAVPGAAVLLLGAAHVGGWAALERTKPPALEELAASTSAEQGSRLRKVVGGIAAFDAVEVVILVYLAYRLWPG